jgi:hypothetical protein
MKVSEEFFASTTQAQESLVCQKACKVVDVKKANKCELNLRQQSNRICRVVIRTLVFVLSRKDKFTYLNRNTC